jgi:hypothetical protein
MKEYMTTDLYTATALLLLTNIQPEYKIVHDVRRTFVNLVWPDKSQLEPHLSQIEQGTLSVDLVKFRDTHLALKTKCIDLTKGRTL